MSGAHGEVHFQDLATVMSKSVREAAAAAGSGEDGLRRLKQASKLGGLQGLATKVRRAVAAPPRARAAERGPPPQAIEKYAMVKDALRFTTRTNDAFPSFGEDQLVGLVRAMVKQEFFVGQHLATQVTRGCGTRTRSGEGTSGA
jgi:hypothetical protein